MELKWTSDRQPVKPSEPSPAKSASSAPGSELKKRSVEKKIQRRIIHVYCSEGEARERSCK